MAPALSDGRKDVDQYLAELAPADGRALGRVRALVRRVAPEAREQISYGMPSFDLEGRLVYYAAFSDHLSLFPASVRVVRRFASELRAFDVRKGTVRFTAAHPLPAGLLTRIVRARVAENRARARGRTTRSGGGRRAPAGAAGDAARRRPPRRPARRAPTGAAGAAARRPRPRRRR